MVTMSARINQGGGSLIDSGVADVFAKALFGDPEREMKLALGRSDLATDDYNRRKLQAAIEYDQARTAFQTGQNAAVEGAIPAAGQLALDNLKRSLQPAADAKVAAAEAATTRDIGSHMGPVPIEELMPVETANAYDELAAAGDPRASMRYDEPVPITTPVPVSTPDPAGPAAVPAVPTGSSLSPQELLPAGVSREPVPVELPENMDTVAEKASALVAPGLYTNDPMGQAGKGAGLTGAVYGGNPNDPTNAMLYTGKTPAESAGAAMEGEQKLRKEFFDQKPVQRFDITHSRFKELLDASTAANHGVGDTVMVYAIIKMLDPTSSVMGGEQVTAENAPGISASMAQQINNLLNMKGDKWNDAGRAAFVESARKIYESRKNEYVGVRDYYARLAKENGFKPENVIYDFDEVAAGGGPLPPGLEEDVVAATMAANPGMTREDVINAYLEQQGGGGGGTP